MKFVVYSRATMMAATPPDKPWAVISICENGDFPEIYQNEFLVSRLNLQFHDVDEYKRGDVDDEERAELEQRILFSWDHARQVVDFTQEMISKEVSVIYVHCLMGRCRSAGIAAALDKVFNGDDAKYFGRGPYQPNMRVYRGVMDECHQQGLI